MRTLGQEFTTTRTDTTGWAVATRLLRPWNGLSVVHIRLYPSDRSDLVGGDRDPVSTIECSLSNHTTLFGLHRIDDVFTRPARDVVVPKRVSCAGKDREIQKQCWCWWYVRQPGTKTKLYTGDGARKRRKRQTWLSTGVRQLLKTYKAHFAFRTRRHDDFNSTVMPFVRDFVPSVVAALFRCLIIVIIYLSPVNGFIIVFILCLYTRPGAFLIWYTLLFPHMAPALYATVRTHIYYGWYQESITPRGLWTLVDTHAGPAISWPWTSMAATRYSAQRKFERSFATGLAKVCTNFRTNFVFCTFS